MIYYENRSTFSETAPLVFARKRKQRVVSEMVIFKKPLDVTPSRVPKYKLIHGADKAPIRTIRMSKTSGNQKMKNSPVRCTSWEQYSQLVQKYCKPVRYGPRGRPIYDYAKVLKVCIPPRETR